MIVQPARLSDVETLMEWRRERAAWLANRGEDQWQIPWPRWAVSGSILAGQTWMVVDGDTPAASVTLTAGVDLDTGWTVDSGADRDPDALWYPSDDPGNALYISKLMVPIAYAGLGLGIELLAWAGGRAYEAELMWLRLNTWTTNIALQDWYRRLGFAHVRTVPSRSSGACFQRPSAPYTGWRLKTRD